MRGVTADKWPPSIGKQEAALDVAVAQGCDVERWPDEETVLSAEQPRAIAAAIIPSHHPHLQEARIAYLWLQSIEQKGRTVLGRASIANAKVRFFAHVEYVIEFNWVAWQELGPHQRAALVDHELMHCGFDDEKDKVVRHGWPAAHGTGQHVVPRFSHTQE